jgi:hypothetical protein
MVPRLRFSVTQVIHGSNDAVWKVLGDFGCEHLWTKTLIRCTRDTPTVRVGTSRYCELPRPLMGRTEVKETLTEFEPGKSLGYTLEGGAGPFALASSRWSIGPASSNSAAVMVEGSFEAKNRLVLWFLCPVIKPMVRRLTRRVVGELGAFLSADRTVTVAPPD